MRFSPSMIKTWMVCPKQAHFKEILNLPEGQHAKTSFGTCIHSALELYNVTGDVDMAVEHFKEAWDDPSILDAEIDVWPPRTSWGELNQRGIQAVIKFHEDNRWETRNIIAAEHKFLVPFGDHVLSGIIDSLELVGSGKKKELRIIDYKTSSYTPTHLQLRFDVQFTVYMYATLLPQFWVDIEGGEQLFEDLLEVRRRGVWYSIWHQKTLDVGPREELDLQRLYRVLDEIERAVESDVYVPSIDGNACMWCAYTHVCPSTIPLAEEVEIVRRERLR